jgi:fatty acid desaturase
VERLTPADPVRLRRTRWSIAIAGLAAFLTTLAIPAIAALWWLLAVATVVSVAWVTGMRVRGISPEAAAARGR